MALYGSRRYIASRAICSATLLSDTLVYADAVVALVRSSATSSASARSSAVDVVSVDVGWVFTCARSCATSVNKASVVDGVFARSVVSSSASAFSNSVGVAVGVLMGFMVLSPVVL